MAQTDIRLVVDGPEAEAVAGELCELVLENFGHRTEPVKAGAGNSGPGKKIDPALVLSAASLVVSVPAAILAVSDIVRRVQKKPEAEKFLEGTNASLDAHSGTDIRIRKPDGTLVQVRGADAGTLMDIFTEALR